MAIETIDDIVEEIANKLGIYGTCKCEKNQIENVLTNQMCRICFVIDLKKRLYDAFEIEHMGR